MIAANICQLLLFLLIGTGINEILCHETANQLPFDLNPALQSANIDEICEDVFFEARPFPDNKQLFIGCIRSVGYIFNCFGNELFDEILLKCVESSDTTLPIATTSPPDNPNLDGVCDGRIFEFIEHPFDCGKAIFCYEQSPIVRECPKGNIFDINVLR